MSGPAVSQALQERFDAIRRAELDRLRKKLGHLSDDDRQSVEAITADIITAIARVPARMLAGRTDAPHLDALVQLFALDPDQN